MKFSRCYNYLIKHTDHNAKVKFIERLENNEGNQIITHSGGHLLLAALIFTENLLKQKV